MKKSKEEWILQKVNFGVDLESRIGILGKLAWSFIAFIPHTVSLNVTSIFKGQMVSCQDLKSFMQSIYYEYALYFLVVSIVY